MPDGYSFTITIMLPEGDARAVRNMCTGIDPGPNDPDTEAIASEHVGNIAANAVRDLLRRAADFRPLSASVVVSQTTTDPNASFAVTTGDPA
jgi:hypothetical protein